MGEPVGVEVTDEKRSLEEDEAGEPDGGGSSEDGEELLGGERLDEEEEEGREEGGGAVESSGGGHGLGSGGVLGKHTLVPGTEGKKAERLRGSGETTGEYTVRGRTWWLAGGGVMAIGRVVATLTFVAVLQVALSHQPENQGGEITTLRQTKQTVIVDVVVGDRYGNAVSGLKREDFTIFEDGKPQPITFFEAHGGAPMKVGVLPKLPEGMYSNFPVPTASDAINVVLLELAEYAACGPGDGT